MSITYTKEKVIEALDMLSKGIIQPAEEYLDSFQKSLNAWNIVTEILYSRPYPDMKVLTFSAICIAKKIKLDFEELRTAELISLRDLLIDLLKNAAMMPDGKPLVVQLAVCLSVLGLMSGSWNPELRKFVRELSGWPEHVMALLEVLKVLPEETRPLNLAVNETALEYMKHELRFQSNYVLNVLEELLERQDLPSLVCLPKCLEVCGSWIKFGLVSPDDMLERKLYQRINIILVTPQVEGHLEATECIVAMLKQSLVSDCLDSKLAKLVISLEPALIRSTSNLQLMQNYCDIFVNLFRTFFKLTRTDPTKIEERKLTISLLLLIAEHCPLKVIETSLEMWSLLSENKKDPQKTIYQPYFMKLLGHLFPRLLLPESYESIVPPGPLDMHRFREPIAEFLGDICHLVDINTMDKLFNVVRNEMSPWAEVEVAVFFLQHFIKNFKESQTHIIVKILDSIKNRKQTFIRQQVLELISIPKTVDLDIIWSFLLNELRQERPLLAAVNCRLELLLPHWSFLIVLASMVDEFHLEETDRYQLLVFICNVLRQLPESDIPKARSLLSKIEWRMCPNHELANRINVIQNL
ncbi:importin-13 [Drosophila eugracilis]|uniref:importin-13 n=1 Tax=Drosophila eugracilis TaxID=29029 RepID=UPI0007E7530A|nr:importin-13 [Drosophila eugracilis]